MVINQQDVELDLTCSGRTLSCLSVVRSSLDDYADIEVYSVVLEIMCKSLYSCSTVSFVPTKIIFTPFPGSTSRLAWPQLSHISSLRGGRWAQHHLLKWIDCRRWCCFTPSNGPHSLQQSEDHCIIQLRVQSAFIHVDGERKRTCLILSTTAFVWAALPLLLQRFSSSWTLRLDEISSTIQWIKWLARGSVSEFHASPQLWYHSLSTLYLFLSQSTFTSQNRLCQTSMQYSNWPSTKSQHFSKGLPQNGRGEFKFVRGLDSCW